MYKHVQIRNLQESKHRKLKARAAEHGLTITDYVKQLLDRDLERPSMKELVARARKLSQPAIGTSTVEELNADRESH
jgi:antitoxin FitA